MCNLDDYLKGPSECSEVTVKFVNGARKAMVHDGHFVRKEDFDRVRTP